VILGAVARLRQAMKIIENGKNLHRLQTLCFVLKIPPQSFGMISAMNATAHSSFSNRKKVA
jgi:hypothetical protein